MRKRVYPQELVKMHSLARRACIRATSKLAHSRCELVNGSINQLLKLPEEPFSVTSCSQQAYHATLPAAKITVELRCGYPTKRLEVAMGLFRIEPDNFV